jgi:hypothetical protein
MLRFATIMMSEMLYVFLTALIIFTVLKWDVNKAFSERKKLWVDIGAIILLSASLAYLYFVRTMGVSLIIAVFLFYGIEFLEILVKNVKKLLKTKEFALSPEMKQLIKCTAICAVLLVSFLAPKMAWDRRNMQAFGKTESSYVNDFMKKEGGGKMETVADWKQRFKNNTADYIAKYVPTAIFNSAPNAEKTATAGDWLKGLAIIALMFFAFFKNGKNGLVLFFYIGITFCVLVAYTEIYTGHRYMTPIMPFLIFLFLYGFYEFVKLLIDKTFKIKESKIYVTILTVAVCGIFFFGAQPSYAKSLENIKLQAKYKSYNQYNAVPQFLEFIQAAQWTKANLPDTARIASRKPEIYYIFTDNRKCAGFPQYATPEEVLSGFEKNKIDYVIIDWWFKHAYATIVPCIQKYPDRFSIIMQIGGSNNQPATYVVKFLHL